MLNNGKVSKEQSDMRVITTALATYYNDNNKFPSGTYVGAGTATSPNPLVTAGLIKSGFNWQDGFGNYYVYQSSAHANHYILIAPGDNTSADGVVTNSQSGSTGGTWTSAAGDTAKTDTTCTYPPNLPAGTAYPAVGASGGSAARCFVSYDK